ncbi:hypothetical protein I6F35_15420 [Bradyrhizobium sp. BRP22]|uniref:hypothetical protein n=1 Tax=Bradyrhizobium sp. BRP22 TaxID=2793821 RepID=UPI001CD3A976|nr:hypothetical protein [Bradyrhizobium sp. BRP22]MCA1454601.1 hypothetical protein [Bradyrhizobium sp. BRP22]
MRDTVRRVNDVSDLGPTFIDDIPLRKDVVSEPVTRNDDLVSVNSLNRCCFSYPVVGRPTYLKNNWIAKRQLSHVPLPTNSPSHWFGITAIHDRASEMAAMMEYPYTALRCRPVEIRRCTTTGALS